MAVHAVGSVRLLFDNNYILALNNIYCIPSIKRNLISGSQFVMDDAYSLTSNNKAMYFYNNSSCFGNANLVDGYWLVNCTHEVSKKYEVYNISTTKRAKRKRKRYKSSFLWHKRLGHVSKQRMHELIKQEIVPPLDFSDFDTCVDCLKGKMTNQRHFNSRRSSGLLDLIHTDVCGPFLVKTICGNSHFVTFTDDFSRYCFVYLISEKSQVLEVFKKF